jgi:hypothetical protein
VYLVKQDSAAWVAMEAMSKCLGDDEDFEQAVFWMEKALETICSPFKDTGIDVFLLATLSHWKRCLGDQSTAREVAYTYVTIPFYIG